MLQAAGIREPVDDRVISKIEELTTQGVRKLDEVKRHVESFVTGELFRGRRPPAKTRRRYYPTNKDITNTMQKVKYRQCHSKVDQENLEHLVNQWKSDYPGNAFFYRRFQESDGNAESVDQNILFVYQSKDQKRLLRRYGNQMSLLDATYRTTRYALPLFFLCVRTNVCYEVVAAFVTQNEDASSIAEALEVIQQRNPDWSPKLFMVDFDKAEITALEEVFPG